MFTDHQEREAAERATLQTGERIRDQILGQVIEIRNKWSAEMRQYPAIHAHLEQDYMTKLDQINNNLLALQHVVPVYAFVNPFEIRDAARDPEKYMTKQTQKERQSPEPEASLAPTPVASEERIEVKPEAQQLIEKINSEIVSYEMRAKDISDDVYTTVGENRDIRSMLQVIKDHVASGRKDINLTTDVDYMQDITRVALDKDVYERVIARVGDFIAEATTLGHSVSVTDFGENDREHRWDFAEPKEQYDDGEPEDRYDIHRGPASNSMEGVLSRAVILEPSDNAMLRNIPRELAP